METTWRESIWNAVRRIAARHGSDIVTRRQIINEELDTIVTETGSEGETPAQTLSYELQNLRKEGRLSFLGKGEYKIN
jgi:hypothetical protein